MKINTGGFAFPKFLLITLLCIGGLAGPASALGKGKVISKGNSFSTGFFNKRPAPKAPAGLRQDTASAASDSAGSPWLGMSLFRIISASEPPAFHGDIILRDTTKTKADSLKNDSTKNSKIRISKDSPDAPVKYSADDSTIFDMANGKILLYNNSEVDYKDIKLQAYYIVFDWKNNIVTAVGKQDSATGKITGEPYFSQGDDSYEAKKIVFNFKTKKGKVTDLLTEQQGGYIHSKVVKKNPDNSYFAKGNAYTTCNYKDHPDFYINSSRMQVIPNKVIVSGPANLVIEDVPTPLFVPFAIFPIHKDRASGIIIPTYGDRADLGYFLSNGGYYFAISDYVDLALKGDIYSRGSWRGEVTSDYKKRYKYNGNVDFSYARTINFTPELDKVPSTDFSFRWNFAQDPKSSPKSHFNASVNFASSKYNTTFAYAPTDVLNNTYQSSISYQRTLNDKMNLSINLNHSQSTETHLVTLGLPTLSFTVSRITPFKKAVSSTTPKWYEKIGFSWEVDASNTLQQYDSLLFKAGSGTLKKFSNGLKQSIPVSTSFNIFKYLTVSPSFNFDQYMYLQSVRENWNPALNEVVIDTVHGFATGIDYNMGISLSTKIFGIKYFKKGKLKAIRHVFTPSAGVSYQPDFGAAKWGNYKSVKVDSQGDRAQYSIFQAGTYGGPPDGKFGGINFGVDNTLDMKVFSKKDTVNHTKKVTLLDDLALHGSYNFAVDTLRLSPLTLAARTTFLNKLNIVYSSTFDPYAEDSSGRRINKFEWDEDHKLARLTDANISLGGSFNSPKKANPTSTGSAAEKEMIKNNPDDYEDFNVPWNISAYYTLSLEKMKVNGHDTSIFTQSINVNFDFSLTKQWKVNASVNFDFTTAQFSYSTIELVRDLHCWQMTIRWVPFGPRQGYYLTLNVKSSVLQDLKLTRKSPEWGLY